MADLAKLAAAIRSWGWRRTAFLVAIGLLAKQIVNFDQALTLILLGIVLEFLLPAGQSMKPTPDGERKRGK